jgi:proteasome-associated ATPase
MTTKRHTDEHLEELFQPGGSTAEKLKKLQRFREDPELSQWVDVMLLERIARQHQALAQAETNMREAQAVIDKVTAPPWYPACFIRLVQTGQAQRALVREGTVTRLVAVGDGVDPASLCACDEVYLSQNQNMLLGRMQARPSWRSGETCSVKNMLGDGRLVVVCRGEELVVHAPPSLRGASLKEGDQVLCDLATGIALEHLERQATSHLFLETTPPETFADVGGLDAHIQRIKDALLLHWQNPQVAKKYQLPRTGAILLCGPPGTGKTLIARAFANFIGSLAPSGQSLFANIKPGELHSMWYAESERNYREMFRLAREKGTIERPVVLFFDEIDAIGSSRGQSHMRVNDTVLTSLIAELDGLHERGNVLVVAATNRRDALDPALVRPGRLGDLVLEVPRPNRPAAREIFAKHLQAEIPFACNGHGNDLAATRAEVIGACLARIYSPNAEELATVAFRDGSRRSVRPVDLMSGAVIANICRNAKRKACQRELSQSGEAGLTAEDLLLAIGEEFCSVARGITVFNCRQHLELPQDLDVVKVEPVARKVTQPQRFLQAA